MKMECAAKTDIGKLREVNEDAYLVAEKVFAVADGMGGHQAGEVASRLALETFKQSFKKIEQGEKKESIEKRLKESIKKANEMIFKKGASHWEYLGMGTTLTVAAINGVRVYLGHVGDSRAYLIRRNEITQLTKDHTLVAEMVRRGEINSDLARVHPLKNVLTRSLGTSSEVEVDFTSIQTESGDVLLLCTDGLSSMLRDEEILNLVIGTKDLKKACQKLIEAANARGGEDNITVVLIKWDKTSG